MSELIDGGVATAAVNLCTRTVAGVGHAVSRSAQWLTDQRLRDIEKLEKALEAPSLYLTTTQARENLVEQLTQVQRLAAQHPTLSEYADSVARIIALHRSPIGSFVSEEQWKTVCSPTVTRAAFHDVIAKASAQFTQANARYVNRSIVEVAEEAGFTERRYHQQLNGKETLVLADSVGRALITEVVASDDGANISFDLTGFGDGSCHPVMDQILEELVRKQIHLGTLRRQSHYRREGGSPVTQEYVQSQTQNVRATVRKNMGTSERKQRSTRLAQVKPLATHK